MVLALELEEVDQGSEEEEKKLDLERVEEEEEERSMRGQDVEKRAPSRPLLGSRSTEGLPRPALFYNDLSQVDRGQSFQKRK